MRKKLCATVLAMSSLMISTHAFSMNSYVFQSGLPVEYELPPNDPQVFSNIFMWPVKASCKIISTTPENVIAFRVLRKDGSVNNTKMTTGDQMTLVFYPNEVVRITAAAGGKVEMKNLGEQKISALCSTEN
jgi:hypothetical protein